MFMMTAFPKIQNYLFDALATIQSKTPDAHSWRRLPPTNLPRTCWINPITDTGIVTRIQSHWYSIKQTLQYFQKNYRSVNHATVTQFDRNLPQSSSILLCRWKFTDLMQKRIPVSLLSIFSPKLSKTWSSTIKLFTSKSNFRYRYRFYLVKFQKRSLLICYQIKKFPKKWDFFFIWISECLKYFSAINIIGLSILF